MDVTVIIPAHNPDPARLRRVFQALRCQSLAPSRWHTLLVDNASSPALDVELSIADAPSNLQLCPEPTPGLSHARRRGIASARGRLCVFVDDDNLLTPDYLEIAVGFFAAEPRVAAAGGRIEPEFEAPTSEWHREFLDLLAVRDLGNQRKISTGLRPHGARRTQYPDFAPVGAGLVLRTDVAQQWAAQKSDALSDRTGGDLSSAGDNDIVFTVLELGWEVAYVPELALRHVIPARRLDARYLARLNHGIQKSWMHVLTKHEANPWPAISAWTVPWRKTKAWFTYRAWTSPSARIRWAGACGHFEGRSN